MKHIINKILISLATAVILTGCFELDRAPFNEPSSATFWKTEAQCKQGVMGVYQALHNGYKWDGTREPNDLFGRQFMFDIQSDLTQGRNGYIKLALGTVTPSEGFVGGKWKAGYELIQRANTVIRNVSLAEIDQTVKDNIIGEAKFLRALGYFHLNSHFGGLPIYDETFDINVDYANMTKVRSSDTDVKAFIIKDLTEAAAALPIKWADTDYGRATKGAAYALMGKVHLYGGNYLESITSFTEVLEPEYGYALGTNFTDIFTPADDSGTEMIFAIQNRGGVGTNYGMQMAWSCGGGGTNFGGGGWMDVFPSTTLYDIYELKDGSKLDWDKLIPGYNTNTGTEEIPIYLKREEVYFSLAENSTAITNDSPHKQTLLEMYAKRDPRMGATLIVPFSKYDGWRSNEAQTFELVWARKADKSQVSLSIDKGFLGTANEKWQTCLWRKFVPVGNMDGLITSRHHTPINFPLIRLADVYLLLAEAYNENGNQGDAIKYINMVRTRPSVNMPAIGTEKNTPATTRDQVHQKIMDERAYELANEGHREGDLRRWRKSEELCNGRVRTLTGVNMHMQKFNPNKDYLWPIPTSEIDINKELTQNPGW